MHLLYSITNSDYIGVLVLWMKFYFFYRCLLSKDIITFAVGVETSNIVVILLYFSRDFAVFGIFSDRTNENIYICIYAFPFFFFSAWLDWSASSLILSISFRNTIIWNITEWVIGGLLMITVSKYLTLRVIVSNRRITDEGNWPKLVSRGLPPTWNIGITLFINIVTIIISISSNIQHFLVLG